MHERKAVRDDDSENSRRGRMTSLEFDSRHLLSVHLALRPQLFALLLASRLFLLSRGALESALLFQFGFCLPCQVFAGFRCPRSLALVPRVQLRVLQGEAYVTE